MPSVLVAKFVSILPVHHTRGIMAVVFISGFSFAFSSPVFGMSTSALLTYSLDGLSPAN